MAAPVTSGRRVPVTPVPRRLIAGVGRLNIAQSRDTTGEDQRRRSPIRGLLIVADDACFARNIAAIHKVGGREYGLATILNTEIGEESCAGCVTPEGVGHRSIDAAGVEESEQIGGIVADVLPTNGTVDLILASDASIRTPLQFVLMNATHHRHLIVVTRTSTEIGQRTERQ